MRNKKVCKVISVLLILALLLAGGPMSALATGHPFHDVRDGRWYAGAVRFVYENNIMSGVERNQFNPQGDLTRAIVASSLFRIHHGRTANAQDSRNNEFHDVAGAWYAPYVTWAFNNNIVLGTSPTTFNPHGTITRQEFATMMYRYAMHMTSLRDESLSAAQWAQLTDRGRIGTWAYPALRWMNFHSIVTGSTATTINPTGTTTRAEGAMIMMRFVELLPSPRFPTSNRNSLRTGTSVPFFVGSVNRGIHSNFSITIANSLPQLRAINTNDLSGGGITIDGEPREVNLIHSYTSAFFNDRAIVLISITESVTSFVGWGHDIELVRNGNVLGVNIQTFLPGAVFSEGRWRCVYTGESLWFATVPDYRVVVLEVNREDIAGITSIEYFRRHGR